LVLRLQRRRTNYHADAILGLLHGVNPIYGQFSGAEPMWSNHYPKATWYFAGKIYNFLLIFAAMAFAVGFFRREGLGARSPWCLASSRPSARSRSRR
jgi:hypothetical protein